jgi:hypothetical protein
MILFAVIFAMSTILNPDSRYYIDSVNWSALWDLLTGQ